MSLIERRVPDGDTTLTLIARYDNRLRKTVRWTVQHDQIVVRVPRHLRRPELERILDQVVEKVRRQRARARRRQDRDLHARAEAINRRYFGGELNWHTIRWVTNMEKRLGSCSSGGSTDGDIRISERVRHWPDYVVDYIIAHELAHRKHPNHSRAFWDYLARYPLAERARGFLEGIAYAEHGSADDML